MYSHRADVFTSDYDNLGNYAKVMEIPIGKYGQQIYNNTFNMSFRVIWAVPFNSYRFKDFAVMFKSDLSISLEDITPLNSGYDVKAVVQNEVCTFYVAGAASGTQVQVKILHCNRPNYIRFLELEKFNNNLTGVTTISPSETVATPTYNNNWTPISTHFNRIKKSGNLVVVNLSSAPGYISDGFAFARIPIGFRPTADIYNVCVMRKSDNTHVFGRFRINTSGDIIINGIVSGVTEVYTHITYTV